MIHSHWETNIQTFSMLIRWKTFYTSSIIKIVLLRRNWPASIFTAMMLLQPHMNLLRLELKQSINHLSIKQFYIFINISVGQMLENCENNLQLQLSLIILLCFIFKWASIMFVYRSGSSACCRRIRRCDVSDGVRASRSLTSSSLRNKFQIWSLLFWSGGFDPDPPAVMRKRRRRMLHLWAGCSDLQRKLDMFTCLHVYMFTRFFADLKHEMTSLNAAV